MSGSLAQKMAGEIVFSENPGETLKKWREIFGLTQKEMATLLEINPSVVCDFEKGRRDSPGIKTVKKMVDTKTNTLVDLFTTKVFLLKIMKI